MSTGLQNALITTGFIVAGVLLIRSMLGHLRKVRQITADGTVPVPPAPATGGDATAEGTVSAARTPEHGARGEL